MPVFSIADAMIWIRDVRGLWEIAALSRLSSSFDGMLNTQGNYPTKKEEENRRI